MSWHDSLIFTLCSGVAFLVSKVYLGTISLHLCQELPLLCAHGCVFHDWVRPFEFLSGRDPAFHWIQHDPTEITSEKISQDLPKLQSCLGVQNMARLSPAGPACQGRDQFSVECRTLRYEPWFNMIQRGTTGIYKHKARVATLLLFIVGHLWHVIFPRSAYIDISVSFWGV